MQHWLAYWLGLTNASGPIYSFWSGIGSDLGEAVLIGGVFAFYRKHECHEDTCHRVGRHTVVDPVTGEHVLRCRHHHQVWKAGAA